MLVKRIVIKNLDNDKYFARNRSDESWVRDINDASLYDSEAEIQKEFAEAEENNYGKLSPEYGETIIFSFETVHILQPNKS